jgi:hypothetical protein
VPAAPDLVEARTAPFVGPVTTTIIPGARITLLARNTDTAGVEAIFRWGGNTVTQPLISTTVPFGPTGGLLHEFLVPPGIPESTDVSVTLRITVNGEQSAESNMLILSVPIL